MRLNPAKYTTIFREKSNIDSIHFHLHIQSFFSFSCKKRAGYLFDNLLFFLILPCILT